MAGKQRYDQLCPLATALDVVGGRWALLVVRELMLGPRRFTDIHRQLESASTDMVASRLRELEVDGVVEKLPDRRYRLTANGLALAPLMRSLLVWSFRAASDSIAGATVDPEVDVGRRLLTIAAVAARTSRGNPEPGEYRLVIGDHVASVSRVGDRYLIREAEVDSPDGTMAFTVDGWMNFVFGAQSIDQIVASGDVEVAGDLTSRVLDGLDVVLQQIRDDVADDFYDEIASRLG